MSNPTSSDELFIARKIYAIRCNLDNIIYYVGSTKNNLQRRMNQHVYSHSLYNNNSKRYIYDKFTELGVDNFSIELVKEYLEIDKKGILAMETLWIYKMKLDKNNCNIQNCQPPIGVGRKIQNLLYNKSHVEDKSIKHKEYREKNKDKFKCDICDFKTYCKSDFNIHTASIRHRINSGESIEIKYSYNCEYCDFKENDKKRFVKHLKSKEHLDLNLSKEEEDKIYTYIYNCNICNFNSDVTKEYNFHVLSKEHIIKSKEEYKPAFKCDLCNYSNNLEKNYKKHIKTVSHLAKMTEVGISINENEIKYKYKCEKCKFKSDDKTQYNKHLICKSHCDVFGIEFKPKFKCDVCDCGFIDVSGLNKHLKSKLHMNNS